MNLSTKYRPSSLDEVRGQDAIVSALRATFADMSAGSFLLCGPSGVGKTTLARILAMEWGASGESILEVDAASSSGVDAVRDIVQFSRYKGIAGSGRRAIIVDECHRLSRQAWDVLLKPIEEPAKHVVWILCTTEKAKVPKTIQTRCASFDLGPVCDDGLKDLLMYVIRQEGMTLTAKVGKRLISRAGGSPRQMLTLLGQVAGLEESDAMVVLDDYQAEGSEIIDLCRLIAKGGRFKSAAKLVKEMGLDKGGAENARRMILGYFCAIALKGESPGRAIEVIAAFEMPYPPEDHNSGHHLILSLAQCCEI